MLTAAIFLIDSNWKQPDGDQQENSRQTGISYTEILLSNKKERIIDTYGMDQSPENWAQSQSPKVVYCIVSFIEHI